MKFKIGQEIEVTEDFELIGGLSGDKIEVKKGDTGFIDSNGSIHYQTGKARGKIHKLTDAEIKGYDTGNIAKIAYKYLERHFNIREYLEDYEIEEAEFIDELDYILSEIL